MTEGDQNWSKLPALRSDDVALDQRRAVAQAVEAEGGEVERHIAAVADQLGEAAADGGALLDAVAGEAVGELAVGEVRVAADQAVLVERVVSRNSRPSCPSP